MHVVTVKTEEYNTLIFLFYPTMNLWFPFTGKYDGHSNCYIETGRGKGALIDFNYNTEPLPGSFPLPGIGPFKLLKETRMNHYGKLIFRWIYWHILLKGKEMPISTHMTMAGKKT